MRLNPLALLLVMSSGAAFANDRALKFFDDYVGLNHQFDVAVAELYTDDAKIHSLRKYTAEATRYVEFTGRYMKGLMKTLMPMAKTLNDINDYSNIEVMAHGAGFKIKADRYSRLKCYADTAYYMVVAPDADGALRIVEEYTEAWAFSQC